MVCIKLSFTHLHAVDNDYLPINLTGTEFYLPACSVGTLGTNEQLFLGTFPLFMRFGTVFPCCFVCFLAARGSFFHGVSSGAGVNRGSWKRWSVNILECVLLHVKGWFSRLLELQQGGLSQHTQRDLRHERSHTYTHRPGSLISHVQEQAGNLTRVDWNVALHSFPEFLKPHICFSLTLMFDYSMYFKKN